MLRLGLLPERRIGACDSDPDRLAAQRPVPGQSPRCDLKRLRNSRNTLSRLRDADAMIETLVGRTAQSGGFFCQARTRSGLRDFGSQIADLAAMSAALESELGRTALVLGERACLRETRYLASRVHQGGVCFEARCSAWAGRTMSMGSLSTSMLCPHAG